MFEYPYGTKGTVYHVRYCPYHGSCWTTYVPFKSAGNAIKEALDWLELLEQEGRKAWVEVYAVKQQRRNFEHWTCYRKVWSCMNGNMLRETFDNDEEAVARSIGTDMRAAVELGYKVPVPA